MGSAFLRRRMRETGLGTVMVALTILTGLGWRAVPVLAAQGGTGPSTTSWERYVEGPGSTDVRPVAVASTSGDVSEPDALVTGNGTTTLTMKSGATLPTILLDYGKDVGGQAYFDVSGETGAPTLRGAFSEARSYLTETGDGTRGAARFGDVTPSAAGRFLLPFQGGERFELLTLTTPGTVRISAVGIQFEAYRATPAQYQGHFLSSSPALNRMWYDGAYTVQLDMVPSGVDGWRQDAVLDGAKRDREIWAADMTLEGPTIYDSLGSNGSGYVKASLSRLINPETDTIDTTADGHAIAYAYSLPYQLDVIDGLVDYYRATGDAAFAEQELPALTAEMTVVASSVNDRGLLVTTSKGWGAKNHGDGADWDIYDGGKSGAVTAYNAIYYHTLVEMAYLELHLGDSSQADTYTAEATALKKAINTDLFDPATGAYQVSNEMLGTIPEDGNAEAVLYGVAPYNRAIGTLGVLKDELWTARGSEPFSSNTGYSDIISPYVNGIEIDARFASGDTADAIHLLQNMWGQMINVKGPYYTGTFWEKIDPDGRPPDSETSLAHGWSTTPTSALTQYVLGVQAVAPGYATWRVEPHPGTLAWAEGTVPTPKGAITESWRQGRTQGLTLSITIPAGTNGTVAVPASAGQAVVVDGKVAWTGGRALADDAYRSGSYVTLTGVSGGHHTFQVRAR